MSDEILKLFISDQLVSFNADSRCCVRLLGHLCTIDPIIFARVVSELGLRMRPYVHDGQETVLVFKDYCHHILTDIMDLKLTTKSVKDMYMLHCNSRFSGTQKDFQMSPDFQSTCECPMVPPHRFSLGPLKQTMVRSHANAHTVYQMYWPMHPYKEQILQALSRNRVLIVNAGFTLESSTAIPMYIIEKCSQERKHCKVICVEREQLAAIYHSELLAVHFHEKIGETVAYQVQLQSRISDSSNLVYTTSNFLLRVLMGQSSMDSFRHVSHIILVDVQLHEAFVDLLLTELKEALKFHPYLKIVLLSYYSKNFEFLQYFGEGEEIVLRGQHVENFQSNILYIEDIRHVVSEDRPSKMIKKAFTTHTISNKCLVEINIKHLDKCLDTYERTAADSCFNKFLYMIHVERANVNHRHTVTGRTALNIACLLGKVEHVQALLELNADPFIKDKLDVDPLKAAIAVGNAECVDLLKIAYFDKMPQTQKDWKNNFIDHFLITDIIHAITTGDKWISGNIIVCLPSYHDLIKLNYILLKEQLLGNLPEYIVLHLLHNQTEKSQLDAIIQPERNKIKIILSTDIAETLMCFEDILYVIDAGRSYRCFFNNDLNCKENVYEWSSKYCLENRQYLLNKNGGGICFRLIPEAMYDLLPEVAMPDLLIMPLDRVCLAVKLLSNHTMVSEYLRATIVTPPFIHIFRCVEYLKKISVFTELEDITWLGCRLIDLPVECRLGKLLVFAILLQCLDPILTIVSFMSTLDPFEITQYLDDLNEPYTDPIRYKIKEERQRYSESVPSDHLALLRLYQEWQNDLRNENEDNVPSNYTFLLKGLLENVCNVRTQLVGALRSSQLIHNKGHLSMHCINLKSNCWPIIKAALVGGLYPSICVLDRKVNRLKSPFKKELILNPDSVLRDLDLDSLKQMNFVSPWVVYGQNCKGFDCCSINCNTIVGGLAVALFAGPTKISFSDSQTISDSNADQCYVHIDEWISFKMDYTTAQLLLKTRQYFFSVYQKYLQNCCLLENCKRLQLNTPPFNTLFDFIEKILAQEDVENNFSQPENIGLRPKAVPNKLTLSGHNSNVLFTSCNGYNAEMYGASSVTCSSQLPKRFVNKQFYMVYKEEYSPDNNTMNIKTHGSSEWFQVLSSLMDPKTTAHQLTFIIFYSRNPDCLNSVAIAEWHNGYLELHPCFKCNIDMYLVLQNMSIGNQIKQLSLAIVQRRPVLDIDYETGIFILNMFAYRNNWLHSN